MNKVTKLFLSLGVASCMGACLLFYNMTAELESQSGLFETDKARRSITFLLGEDKPGYRYFSLAEEHFLFDSEEKTEIVNNSCRSIEDLIHFLNEDKSVKKWGTIQVVLHGNPWQGLSLPLMNEGPRATKRTLAKALMNNPLPKLQADNIDSLTKINLWGCGIGKNPFINIAMDSFFRLPSGEVPDIYTSPHFVIFKEMENGLPPKRIRASYWPYVFKRGYRPSDDLICKELKKQHPDTKIDWSSAIREADTLGNTFQNAFNLPVSWTVTYPTKAARPDLLTHEDKMAWVQSQPALMSQLEELGLPLEKYTWTIGKRILTREDGTKVPAVKAIGMATVLCVLSEV